LLGGLRVEVEGLELGFLQVLLGLNSLPLVVKAEKFFNGQVTAGLTVLGEVLRLSKIHNEIVVMVGVWINNEIVGTAHILKEIRLLYGARLLQIERPPDQIGHPQKPKPQLLLCLHLNFLFMTS
jgi:hypothetical protein